MSVLCGWGMISCYGRTAAPPHKFWLYQTTIEKKKKTLPFNSKLNEINLRIAD